MTAGLDDLRDAFAGLTALHGWTPLQTPRNLLALTGRVGAVASIVQWEAEIGPDAVTKLRAAVEGRPLEEHKT